MIEWLYGCEILPAADDELIRLAGLGVQATGGHHDRPGALDLALDAKAPQVYAGDGCGSQRDVQAAACGDDKRCISDPQQPPGAILMRPIVEVEDGKAGGGRLVGQVSARETPRPTIDRRQPRQLALARPPAHQRPLGVVGRRRQHGEAGRMSYARKPAEGGLTGIGDQVRRSLAIGEEIDAYEHDTNPATANRGQQPVVELEV
jgi:hypothetical protein